MRIENYKNFGRCVVLERGGARAMITIDIGPRIIYYGTDDFNFFCEDIERNVTKEGEFFDREYKEGERWCLYGGHRVWKSPEDLYSYTPDNYPVEYEMTDDFSGKFVCRVSKKFDYTLTVGIDQNGSLNVKNAVKTKCCDEKHHVWALSVMCKNGVLRVPLNEKKDDLNPVQNLVFWPYDDCRDERYSLDDGVLTIRQTDNSRPLKLGLSSKKGRAYYTLGDKTLKITCKTAIDQGEGYPDFQCNFESYTNNHILEVEWLGAENSGCEEGVVEEQFEIVKTPEKFE
ncbi:MAG: hypothetical protein IKD35_02285 [Clostridia bacterium]|nr:hypothetical protein [Clostridia bacterium]